MLIKDYYLEISIIFMIIRTLTPLLGHTTFLYTKLCLWVYMKLDCIDVIVVAFSEFLYIL